MSTARFNTLENAAGTKTVPVATVVDGSAKAWVNFNGTGTVAISASFNVSSITDNGSGVYTVNFTNAMSDVNYAALFGAKRANQTSNTSGVVSETFTTAVRTTSSLSITVGDSTSGFIDCETVSVAIFR